MLATPPADGRFVAILGARVHWAPVPRSLPDATELETFGDVEMRATLTSVLYRDPHVVFRVDGTTDVTIEVATDVAPASVEAYLYGIVARILLMHAGRFNLHATIVATETGVVAIGGESGAGKSTTAAEFAARGARLVIDDVAPLRVDATDVVVEPYPRPVHLFPHAAARTGLPQSGPRTAVGPRGKVALDLAEPSGEAVVDRLVVLSTRDDDIPRVDVVPIAGGERLRAVVGLSNLTGLATLGTRRAAYFAWATQVADRLPVYAVSRPAHADTHDAVIEAIAALR